MLTNRLELSLFFSFFFPSFIINFLAPTLSDIRRDPYPQNKKEIGKNIQPDQLHDKHNMTLKETNDGYQTILYVFGQEERPTSLATSKVTRVPKN